MNWRNGELWCRGNGRLASEKRKMFYNTARERAFDLAKFLDNFSSASLKLLAIQSFLVLLPHTFALSTP